MRRFARASWPFLLLLMLLALRAAGCRKTKEAPAKPGAARTPHWITPLMTPPPTFPPVPTRRGMTPIPTLPG
jgi:type IV pilus biogenesis protein CpaD/CtpE